MIGLNSENSFSEFCFLPQEWGRANLSLTKSSGGTQLLAAL